MEGGGSLSATRRLSRPFSWWSCRSRLTSARAKPPSCFRQLEMVWALPQASQTGTQTQTIKPSSFKGFIV